MATSNVNSHAFNTSWNNVYSVSTQVFSTASWSTAWTPTPQHNFPAADDYACLTDYVKAVLRPQKGCPCKWCKAEPLERAMATVVARKPEGEE